MKKKSLNILSFIMAIVMSLITMPIKTGFSQSQPTVWVSSITQDSGGSVTVPIKISGNTGICGAILSVSYNKALTLTGISAGDALSSLTMTKPGKLTANPINLGWDGMEEDNSNGEIALLTFTVPDTPGTYEIDISYEDGNIVDGNLNPVNITVQNGFIKVAGDTPENTPTITVGSVTGNTGETISVPLNLSGNTGICGAILSVKYDEKLTLTEISEGDALSSLTMTKPGKLTANPINLGWDGLEADITSGTIATLIFTAPEESGIYDINVSYIDGDIVDGNLLPVNIKVIQGQITVNKSNIVSVTIGNKKVTLNGKDALSGDVLIAYYDTNDRLLSIENYPATSHLITSTGNNSADYAQIMWWEDLLTAKPVCPAQTVNLK